MELDWTTFVLEIINFLILVWILKRFLYRPVLGIIEKRRKATEAVVDEARGIKLEAEELKAKYEGELAELASLRETRLAELREEVAAERARQMGALQATLAEEREKSRQLAAQGAERERSGLERQALEQGTQFAARLLSRAAGPDLDRRLAEICLEDLVSLPEGWLAERLSALRGRDVCPEVLTAYPLPEDLRHRFIEALGMKIAFAEDDSLLAGLELRLGSHSLRANLRDELAWFAEETR